MDEPWGNFRAPLLLVPSEKDECVPKHVDKADLLGHWSDSCSVGVRSELSGLVPGANHCVDQPDAQLWLADRVAGFLDDVEKGVEKGPLDPVAMFKASSDGAFRLNTEELRQKGYIQ